MELRVAGDAEFECARCKSPGGNFDEYARILVAHAVDASVRQLTPSLLKLIARQAAPDGDDAAQARAFTDRVRGVTHARLERRIRDGGYLALVALCSPDPEVRAASSMDAAVSSSTGDKESMVASDVGVDLFHTVPPTPQALRRARKYVFSTSLDWDLAVSSLSPLRIRLNPGVRFGGRLLTLLVGDPTDERSRANTLVAWALNAIVARADVVSLMEAIPEIESDQMGSGPYARDALELYRSDIGRQIDIAIDRNGCAGVVALVGREGRSLL
jgi:hypothetical protein